MQVPNWKHNSGKHQKRKLKPQALRQAKARRQALKNKHPKRGVFFYKYLKSICKMDAQDFRSLQVAYMEVYQEIDEELTGERKKRALEKGGYWADRVASGKEGQPLERRDRSGNVTMRTTTKAPNKRGGKEDKGYRKADWPGYEADRGSGNKARRRAEKLNKEEVNLYDIILSHLLDEGYAETPEAAEAIMVNMSEEWRNSILG